MRNSATYQQKLAASPSRIRGVTALPQISARVVHACQQPSSCFETASCRWAAYHQEIFSVHFVRNHAQGYLSTTLTVVYILYIYIFVTWDIRYVKTVAFCLPGMHCFISATIHLTNLVYQLLLA